MDKVKESKGKVKGRNIPPSNPPDGGWGLEELKCKEAELIAREQELIKREVALNARKRTEPPELDFVSPEFKSVFLTWLEYKRERRETYKSDKSLRAAYNKLLELSGNDPVKATGIVEQSMANNWAGLFELKQTSNGQWTGSNQARKESVSRLKDLAGAILRGAATSEG